MIIMGFNQGMQPIAGYNYGARLYSRVTDVTRLTMRWAVGVATLGFLLCQLVPSWIVRMFTSDGELDQCRLLWPAHRLRRIPDRGLPDGGD